MTFRDAIILILEDEPIIGLALEDMLEAEGAKVLLASGIDEARALIAGQRLDLAILDVNVHGAQSYPVARELAALKVPFVFATGYGDRSHPPEFAHVPTVAKPYGAHDISQALFETGLGA